MERRAPVAGNVEGALSVRRRGDRGLCQAAGQPGGIIVFPVRVSQTDMRPLAPAVA